VRLGLTLQLLINRYSSIGFAQVPERLSTRSFVVLMIGNSKSNQVGAQGTFELAVDYMFLFKRIVAWFPVLGIGTREGTAIRRRTIPKRPVPKSHGAAP